jgi:predicted permease
LPDAEVATRGICVLLTGTPNAVASYVISREIGVEEGFVAAMLVVSTALSVITIPVWLYILL